jgi:hypothetical protein
VVIAQRCLLYRHGLFDWRRTERHGSCVAYDKHDLLGELRRRDSKLHHDRPHPYRDTYGLASFHKSRGKLATHLVIHERLVLHGHQLLDRERSFWLGVGNAFNDHHLFGHLRNRNGEREPFMYSASVVLRR